MEGRGGDLNHSRPKGLVGLHAYDPKRGPRGPQLVKISLKRMAFFRFLAFVVFQLLRSKMTPRGPRRSRSTTKEAAQDRPKKGPRGPQRTQRSPRRHKRAPRLPKNALREPKTAQEKGPGGPGAQAVCKGPEALTLTGSVICGPATATNQLATSTSSTLLR